MISLRDAMRDKRVAGALAGLAVLVIVYRIHTAVGNKPAEAPSPAVQVSSGAETGAPAPGGDLLPAPPGKTAPAEVAWSWARNPFLPQWKEPGDAATGVLRAAAAGSDGWGEPGAGTDPLSGLRGTVVSGKSGIAIFGSRLVPVGGRIDRWTVERVDPYAVTLRSANDVRVVELFKPPPTGGKGRGGER